MAISGGPDIVEDGLVLHLDAADTNSYNDYNIVAHSENFTSSFGWVNSVNWGPFGIVANDAIAPNGTQTADKLIFSGASKAKVSNKFAVSEGEVYTISAWVKVPTDSNRVLEQYTNIEFQTYDTSNNLASMAVGGTNYGGDYYKTDRWVRFITTYTVPAGIGYMRGIIHGAQNPLADFSLYVWGVQIVRGSQPLRYHPTANGKGYGINLVDNSYSTQLLNGADFSSNNKGYLKLDGSDAYCRIAHRSEFNVTNNPFTVMVWNRKDDTNNSYTGLITSDSNSDTNWKIHKDINLPYFRARSGSTIDNFPPYTVNKWHLYAFTKSGNSLKLYFDGDLISSATSNDPASFSNDLAIGSYRLNDAIDGRWLMPLSFGPIMFYTKALKPEQILQNYNAIKGRYGL